MGGGDPYAEDSGIGFVPDPIIRSLGVPLVTGDIPGVAWTLPKISAARMATVTTWMTLVTSWPRGTTRSSRPIFTLIFGNVQPGDLAGLLKYTKDRVPAFVNTFGALDPVVVSAGAGAIALDHIGHIPGVVRLAQHHGYAGDVPGDQRHAQRADDGIGHELYKSRFFWYIRDSDCKPHFIYRRLFSI